MRDRKLTIAEALDEYMIYQWRLSEFIHLFQISLDIAEKRYKPDVELLLYKDAFATTRSASTGWFVSLIDSHKAALNVFDVWLALYPDDKAEIEAVWKTIEPYEKVLVDYRGSISFHASKDIKHYFDVRRQFGEVRKEIALAMQEFFGLAAKLLKKKPQVEGDLKDALRKRLEAKVPDADIDGLLTVLIHDSGMDDPEEKPEERQGTC